MQMWRVWSVVLGVAGLWGCGGAPARPAGGTLDQPVTAGAPRPGQNGCIDCRIRACFAADTSLTGVLLELGFDTATQAANLHKAVLATRPDANTADTTLVLDPSAVMGGQVSLSSGDFSHLHKAGLWADAEADITATFLDSTGSPWAVKWPLDVKQGDCD